MIIQHPISIIDDGFNTSPPRWFRDPGLLFQLGTILGRVSKVSESSEKPPFFMGCAWDFHGIFMGLW
jgi:hypothetical protein